MEFARERELIHLQGIDSKYVAMRFIAARGAWSAVTRLAKIGHALDRSFSNDIVRLARIGRQHMDADWNVEDDPMPPSASGRRVRIVHRDGKTLCF